MVTWKAVENPAVPSSGVLAGQPSWEGHHQSWFYPDMNRCLCQSPPVWADGGSWRSGSPAASLSQSGVPGAVLDLLALRPRPGLLQSGLPQRSPAPTTPRCQPSLPAESGRPARSSGPTTCVPATPRAGPRDGSIFPFGHFSGIIRLWGSDHHAGCSPAAISIARRPGKAARSLAALLDLRPTRPLRRSFPTDSTTKVSLHDHSRNPRTDSPLLLRRALENRHDCTSPGRPPRHRTACH